MKGEVYLNRNCTHKNMGPPDSCDRCAGRGHYPSGLDGYGPEIYCECPCGIERRRVETSCGVDMV